VSAAARRDSSNLLADVCELVARLEAENARLRAEVALLERANADQLDRIYELGARGDRKEAALCTGER
jgi:hypothetical protein